MTSRLSEHAMPHHEEEYPDQPVWQSVLLFCCKGMIEGIMVILFFWLLVQVLFTKHLEVHLQILLLVGLITFCLSLVLGCILCWRKSRTCSVTEKQPVASAAAPPERAALSQSPPPSAASTAKRQRYEEVDADLLEYPSTFTSPRPSEAELSSQPLVASNHKEQPKLNFSLRRLSTPPLTSPLYKPIDTSHASLLAFPKLGLFSKTRKALQRRCTIAGDRTSYNEHSRLTVSASMSEEPVRLSLLSYGSSASCNQATLSKPYLHFIMAFTPEQQVLTLTFLNLSGTSVALDKVSLLGSLPPLYPCPITASVQRDVVREPHSPMLLLKVSSVEELQRCTLKIAVHTQEPHNLRGTALGELEVDCGGRDWHAERSFYISQELNLNRATLKKQSLISEEAPACMGHSRPPQIFLLLQYQTLAHRIKATIFRGANLDGLVHTSAGTDFCTDYRVVINLRHDRVVISSRETKGGSSALLNSSFLFELPPGKINQLPLMLEFIIMQDEGSSKDKVLGRVLVGAEAADAGRAHWRDMCTLQVEQVRWHTVQPEPAPGSDTCSGNAV